MSDFIISPSVQVAWLDAYYNYSVSVAVPTIHGSVYYQIPRGFNRSVLPWLTVECRTHTDVQKNMKEL